MSFKQLKKVDIKTKYAVHGWIRRKQEMLKVGNIPAIVNAICILYFRDFEQFDKQLTHPNLEADDEYKILTNPSGRWFVNSFGTNICMEGRKYHWRIKIEQVDSSQPLFFNVGIILSDKAKDFLNGSWFEDFGYSYFHLGYLFHAASPRPYGRQHQQGDIIDVYLDLKHENTLCYGHNHENYGKAFDIDPEKQYRFALNLGGGKATIDGFEVEY